VPGPDGHYVDGPVSVTPETMNDLAIQMGEPTLLGRTGGAATLAVGMAMIFSKLTHGHWLDVWYHFAMMFEALFILTTLDAGTRVGRYLLQDIFKRLMPGFADTKNLAAGVIASALIVAAWGFFLIMGVTDPDGGVKALWPIFGIANQLLASIALCLATTILIKMQLQRGQSPALAFVTLVPLAWLLSVTITASVIKVWDPNPKIGFLAAVRSADEKLPALETKLNEQANGADQTLAAATRATIKATRTVRFNSTIDAWVTGTFLVLVCLIVVLSIYEWLRLLTRNKAPTLSETEPVYLPAGAAMESNPLPAFGIAMLGFTLLKELSGEAAIDRAEVCACAQAGASGQVQPVKYRRQNAFLTATEHRYRGVNRCC
jgi:carbon starvation protein